MATLHPFDVPSVSTGAPEPSRLLVGRPDPRIGRVVSAWSNVTVRPRRIPRVPLFVMSFMGTLGGAAAGMVSGSPYLLVALTVLGAGLGFASVVVVARLFADRRSMYLGEAGYQGSVLGVTGVEDQVALFAESWLLFSRERLTWTSGGQVIDQGDISYTRLVPKRGGHATFVGLEMAPAVRRAVLGARTASGGGPVSFAVLEQREETFVPKGEIVLDGDELAVSDGSRTQRVRLSDLSVALRAGFLELSWPGDHARMEFGLVGDGIVLLAMLETRGVVPKGA
jgi:hypothetical protein